jgi:hypothetical protein
MRRSFGATLGLGLVLASGCAPVATSANITEALRPAPGMPAPAECAADCSASWERAQFWIAKHAYGRLVKNNDVVIETAGTMGKRYTFVALREPLGGGRYRISLRASCSRCDPTTVDVQRAFFHYVNTGIDLLANVRMTQMQSIR